MPHGPWVLKDLIIITALVGLIPKEMNSRVVHPAELLFLLEVLQAVRLVPPCGKDIEGDLAADGESVAAKEEKDQAGLAWCKLNGISLDRKWLGE